MRPFTIIFNKSLSEGVVPDSWKEAEVVPIFKKRKRDDPGNYRPVSLTSVYMWKNYGKNCQEGDSGSFGKK